MHIELKPITLSAADIEQYRVIELAVAPTTPRATVLTTPKIQDIRAEIEEYHGQFIYKDGVVVGLISSDQKKPGEFYINELAILPEYQGQKIGREAMRLMIIPALPYASRIWLVTHPTNGRALRLYGGLGFEVVTLIDDYFGDGEPRLILDLKDRARLLAHAGPA